MSSDEQKRQLLAQKVFRSLKSKQKISSNDQKAKCAKMEKISASKIGGQSQECDLTKSVDDLINV